MNKLIQLQLSLLYILYIATASRKPNIQNTQNLNYLILISLKYFFKRRMSFFLLNFFIFLPPTEDEYLYYYFVYINIFSLYYIIITDNLQKPLNFLSKEDSLLKLFAKY